MMTEKFCIEQAESCARAAAAASLANQRDTLMRARAVWLDLAARDQSIQSARVERERQKQGQATHG